MERARERGNRGLTPSDVPAIRGHFAAGGVFSMHMVAVMKQKNATAGVLAAVAEAARPSRVPSFVTLVPELSAPPLG